MNKKVMAMTCVVLIIAGLILAPVLCMPVNSDEYTNSFSVDVARPVIVTLLAFLAAAVCAYNYVNLAAREKGVMSNPTVLCIGLGAFGLFYPLMVAYKDAANVLNNFYNTWGPNGDKLARYMPEAADKFNITAGNYSKLMWLSLAVVAFGMYKVWKDIKAK